MDKVIHPPPPPFTCLPPHHTLLISQEIPQILINLYFKLWPTERFYKPSSTSGAWSLKQFWRLESITSDLGMNRRLNFISFMHVYFKWAHFWWIYGVGLSACLYVSPCSGLEITAESFMDRLDNGFLLCQLAETLQEKFRQSNGDLHEPGNRKVERNGRIIVQWHETDYSENTHLEVKLWLKVFPDLLLLWMILQSIVPDKRKNTKKSWKWFDLCERRSVWSWVF